jgi:toxin-antitoxin system PIN domain toxin
VKTALLDLNILTALLWPAHEHHDAAHRWFGSRDGAPWATSSLTQLGFVHIVSNPAFSSDALSPVEAVALLKENLTDPRHHFWGDALQLPAAIEGMEGGLRGHKQITAAYLLALAHRRKGVLATFDRGLRTLASAALRDSLEVVPTR